MNDLREMAIKNIQWWLQRIGAIKCANSTGGLKDQLAYALKGLYTARTSTAIADELLFSDNVIAACITAIYDDSDTLLAIVMGKTWCLNIGREYAVKIYRKAQQLGLSGLWRDDTNDDELKAQFERLIQLCYDHNAMSALAEIERQLGIPAMT